MKLISVVTSEYVLIDLSRDLAWLSLARIRIFKAQKDTDPQLDEMYFWDPISAIHTLLRSTQL